jgi:hypothetical protein
MGIPFAANGDQDCVHLCRNFPSDSPCRSSLLLLLSDCLQETSLYVYQPIYESGGAMFPSALQRTLFALACGQLTLIGYLITRGFYFQPIFLVPLPIATIWGIGYFNQHYAGKCSNTQITGRRRAFLTVSRCFRALKSIKLGKSARVRSSE